MLTGQDRVGVLLCSRRFGELWMGFATDMTAGLSMWTNATQLQVAAGVLAGWSQLGRRKGIHFVEDLDSGARRSSQHPRCIRRPKTVGRSPCDVAAQLT